MPELFAAQTRLRNEGFRPQHLDEAFASQNNLEAVELLLHIGKKLVEQARLPQRHATWLCTALAEHALFALHDKYVLDLAAGLRRNQENIKSVHDVRVAVRIFVSASARLRDNDLSFAD